MLVLKIRRPSAQGLASALSAPLAAADVAQRCTRPAPAARLPRDRSTRGAARASMPWCGLGPTALLHSREKSVWTARVLQPACVGAADAITPIADLLRGGS